MVLEKSTAYALPVLEKPLKNEKILLAALLSATFLSAILYFLFERQIANFLIPYLPMDDGKTDLYYYELFRTIGYELLWYTALLLLGLLFLTRSDSLKPFNQLSSFFQTNINSAAWVIIAVSSAIVFVVAGFALQAFPNSSDEYVYFFQAETLSRGNLWEASHPIQDSFGFNHIASKDGITVGRFPVGWPMIMAAFIAVGIPAWMVNPILSIVTLFVFFRLLKKMYGNEIAGWSLVFFAFSPFFIFNSASFFSHTSCLLEAITFIYFLYVYFENRKVKYAVLAGLSLGLIMLIRYYTAFLLFLPVFVITLYKLKFKNSVRLFFFMGVGVLPCLAGFLIYNYLITGNALEPVTVWAYQNEGLGFINGHSVAKGFEHIVRRFMMFCYWCGPVLLALYLLLLGKKIFNLHERLLMPEDYFFALFIVGYFFYYEIGGNQYGPRFYYEGFAFLVAFVIHKVFSSNIRLAKILLYASLVILILKLPFMSVREHKIIDERMDVYNLVKNAGVSNAVVLLKAGTSVTRPMPVGDLTRNDSRFENSVLYAVDDPLYNAQLMDFYRHRRFYRYVREKTQETGKLVPIAHDVR